MPQVKKLTKSPFEGRNDGLVFPGQRFDSYDDKTIVEGYVKEVVKKVGDGEDDFIVEKKLVPYRSYSRAGFIQDAADDVGILNVLRKVAISGQDLTQDNPYAAKPGFVDMTQMPGSLEEAIALVEKAKDTWNHLPDELKNNMDYEAFIKSCTPGQIYDYYKQVAEKEAAAKAAAAQLAASEGGTE